MLENPHRDCFRGRNEALSHSIPSNVTLLTNQYPLKYIINQSSIGSPRNMATSNWIVFRGLGGESPLETSNMTRKRQKERAPLYFILQACPREETAAALSPSERSCSSRPRARLRFWSRQKAGQPLLNPPASVSDISASSRIPIHSTRHEPPASADPRRYEYDIAIDGPGGDTRDAAHSAG
jgi:hypothetical protein